MKILSKFLIVSALSAFSFAPALVHAQVDPNSGSGGPPPGAPPPDYQGNQGDQGDQGASFQTFYDQLGDQGSWVQTDNYGYVFQPNVTDPDWAPYTAGSWVYTDDGWMWVSDEPWGWATYHYGRWANIDGTGWVWIPGHDWGPAWVSWRYGGGYCGWAPLPPETLDLGIGFHFGGDVDVNFHIGAGYNNFVRVEDMGERNYRGHFVNRSNNFAIINHTTNVTNINFRGNRGGGNAFAGISVGGPPINAVNAKARTHVQTVKLTTAAQPGPSALHGNSLAVFAPRINPATAQQSRPANVGQTIGHPTFNRGDSITKPLAVTANVRPPAPTPQAIQAAQQALAHVPASAKIATESTPFHAANSGAATGNTVHTNVEQHNNAAAAPFTGEAVKPVTQPTQVHTNVEHNAPFTGEPASPTATPQKNEAPPERHFENNGGNNPPATTFHPQSQAAPQNNNPPANQGSPPNGGGGGGSVHNNVKAPPHSAPQGNNKSSANTSSTNSASGEHGR